ncbi:MAG: Glu/Leu/Phe/Val family dehydrogenase [Bacteroidia bacterium]
MSNTTELSTAKARDVASALSGMEAGGHEQVVHFYDQATGLKAIVAIHNTHLGPALGGTRMWTYSSEEEALTDVLRLSRGMTYKAAITGLNLGGGKAVIIGDAKTQKSEAMLRRFGKFVNGLAGRYITAEDVNIGTRDIEYIAMETKHGTGLPEILGGGGDPSPVTAYGVFLGMRASAKEVYGNESLAGKKVLVQGVGKVGQSLVEHLVKDGAKVWINDINSDNISAVTQKVSSVTVADAASMFDLDMDVYAPCALGASVNSASLEKLKCAIIAGAANNQLAEENLHGRMCSEKGILYAPDFLINAGGLINVSIELEGYNRERAYAKTERIYDAARNVFSIAKQENIPTIEAAKRLAEQRIEAVGRISLSF